MRNSSDFDWLCSTHMGSPILYYTNLKGLISPWFPFLFPSESPRVSPIYSLSLPSEDGLLISCISCMDLSMLSVSIHGTEKTTTQPFVASWRFWHCKEAFSPLPSIHSNSDFISTGQKKTKNRTNNEVKRRVCSHHCSAKRADHGVTNNIVSSQLCSLTDYASQRRIAQILALCVCLCDNTQPHNAKLWLLHTCPRILSWCVFLFVRWTSGRCKQEVERGPKAINLTIAHTMWCFWIRWE